MIKMIITDVDGTLVKENTAEFPAEILPLVASLQENGILFATASGRQYNSLRDLFAPVAEKTLFFCENGNILRDGNGRVLYQKKLPERVVEKLFDIVAAHPSAEILMGTPDFAYVNLKSEEFRHIMVDVKGSQIRDIRHYAEAQVPVSKISVYCPDGIEDFREHLQKSGWDDEKDCEGVQSDRLWVDFSIGNKGEGIAAFLEMEGIDPEAVMYFGDNYNDVPALELVGHPKLMDTAASELKERFSDVCDSVVGELQRFLDKLQSS